MKKLLIPLFFLLAVSANAQNLLNNDINPPDNPQINAPVVNNTNNTGNLNDDNLALNVQGNLPHNAVPQVQQQVQVQQQAPNRGNIYSTGSNPGNEIKQHKYGQSIQPVVGGGGGFSAGSARATIKKHNNKSLEFTLKKIFKSNYSSPKHYAHKKRVKKCHKF